jgi:hypothetical protein
VANSPYLLAAKEKIKQTFKKEIQTLEKKSL